MENRNGLAVGGILRAARFSSRSHSVELFAPENLAVDTPAPKAIDAKAD